MKKPCARSPKTLPRSAAQHERKIQALEKTAEIVNTTTNYISAVFPYGSTMMSVAKAANGQDVSVGDVGFSQMELAPKGGIKFTGTAASRMADKYRAIPIQIIGDIIINPMNVVKNYQETNGYMYYSKT